MSDRRPPVAPDTSTELDAQLPAGSKTDPGVSHAYMLSDAGL